MADITIHLQSYTEECLLEKAQRGGQTLEAYLTELVELQVHPDLAHQGSDPESGDDGYGERPWRGVFAPRRPRNIVFSVRQDQLPKRQTTLNMTWHRTVVDDE